MRLVMTGDRFRLSADTAANLAIVETMPIETSFATDADAQREAAASIRSDEIVIDALLGTGFSGAVRSPTAELIEAMNAAVKRAMVAVDVPSGLDCDTGAPSNATIRADLTVTFVARKAGFEAAAAAPHVGRVEVADIGVPRELLDQVRAGGG